MQHVFNPGHLSFVSPLASPMADMCMRYILNNDRAQRLVKPFYGLKKQSLFGILPPYPSLIETKIPSLFTFENHRKRQSQCTKVEDRDSRLHIFWQVAENMLCRIDTTHVCVLSLVSTRFLLITYYWYPATHLYRYYRNRMSSVFVKRRSMLLQCL